MNFTGVALQDSLSRFSYPGKLQVVGKVKGLLENELNSLLPKEPPITADGVGNQKIVGKADRPDLGRWLNLYNPTIFTMDGLPLTEFLKGFRAPYTAAQKQWEKTGSRFDPNWGQLNGSNVLPLLAMHEYIHSQSDSREGANEPDLQRRTDILGVRDGVTAVILLLQAIKLNIKGLELNLVDCAFNPDEVNEDANVINGGNTDGNDNPLIWVKEYGENDRQVELDGINKSFQTKAPHYTGCGLLIFLKEHPEIVNELRSLGVVINIHPASTDAFFSKESQSKEGEKIFESYFAFVDGGHSGDQVRADLSNCMKVKVKDKVAWVADDYKLNYSLSGNNGNVVGSVDEQLEQGCTVTVPGPERGCDLVVIGY